MSSPAAPHSFKMQDGTLFCQTCGAQKGDEEFKQGCTKPAASFSAPVAGELNISQLLFDQQQQQILQLNKKLEEQDMKRQEQVMLLTKQQEQAILLLQQRLHRLELTVTTAGDVGQNVLKNSQVDADASFLPSLPSSFRFTHEFLNRIPSKVNDYYVAVSNNASSSINVGRIDEENVQDSSVEMPMKVRQMAEQNLQDMYNVLFPFLIGAVQSLLSFHDTSTRNFLTCPTGKIDVTLTASGYVTWPDVVSFAELKSSLHSKSAYDVAVGQIIQRCQNIFEIQSKRKFIVAMVMDATSIDVLYVSRGLPIEVTHTGRLPFGLSLQSVGLKLLLRLLASSFSQLGFVAPLVPEPFDLPMDNIKRSTRGSRTVKDFISLRTGSLSHRVSALYLATCAIWTGKIVVKFSPAEFGKHEATTLSKLHACPSIPQLLAQGKLPAPIEHLHHYIIIQPHGQHLALTGDDIADAALVCKVLKHICEAMKFAYQQQNILHRDISHGNIVHVNGQGYLIDWHVAFPPQDIPFNDRITGTPLFTSHRLRFPDHLHTLLDDLESLLYVLIYVATGGYLPWDRSPPATMDALKKWHLGEEAVFQLLLNRCISSLRPCISKLRDVLFVPPLLSPGISSSSIAAESDEKLNVSQVLDLQVLNQFLSALQPENLSCPK